jgi:hypothetical protein
LKKKISNLIESRTRDLLSRSMMPQPTKIARTPILKVSICIVLEAVTGHLPVEHSSLMSFTRRNVCPKTFLSVAPEYVKRISSEYEHLLTVFLYRISLTRFSSPLTFRCILVPRRPPKLVKDNRLPHTPLITLILVTIIKKPSDRRLSVKLVSTFADKGCHTVSVTDPHSNILGFLDRSCYFFFQVAPQLYSLLLRKSGSAGNRTRTSGSVARNSDH